MIKKFEAFSEEKKMYGRKNKILIAVSGGIDSAVLLDLMVKSGIKCSIAHCNFKLRGEESDEDEIFVDDDADKDEVTVLVYAETYIVFDDDGNPLPTIAGEKDEITSSRNKNKLPRDEVAMLRKQFRESL